VGKARAAALLASLEFALCGMDNSAMTRPADLSRSRLRGMGRVQMTEKAGSSMASMVAAMASATGSCLVQQNGCKSSQLLPLVLASVYRSK
jgi:hypothetical protein